MEKKLKNGWKVAIDLTSVDSENKNLFNSPMFKSERLAEKWYRKLDFSTCEYSNVDFIMIHYENGEITDTYII